MIIREAILDDINQIQIVRNSVKENMLSNPDLITDKMVEEFLFERGRGWVCEIEDQIVGFSIVDLKGKNVWALFIKPEFEKRGVGIKLHDIMMDWFFNQTTDSIWLGTSPKTRAETFYRKSGWREIGKHGDDEIKFEMSFDEWKRNI